MSGSKVQFLHDADEQEITINYRPAASKSFAKLGVPRPVTCKIVIEFTVGSFVADAEKITHRNPSRFYTHRG